MKSCPPKKRAAATKPTEPTHSGFVEASPSRVLRDGEGTATSKLSHSPYKAFLDTVGRVTYCLARR